MRRNSFTVLLVLMCLTFSCKATRVVSVEALLKQPEKFNHAKVTIAACYVKAFEKTILAPCSGPVSIDNSIWVDSGDFVEATARVTTNPASKPSLAIPSLKQNERSAYLRLLEQPVGTSTSVVVEGEFQTTAAGGYGPGYKSRLILHRVLEIKTDR
jgi:hypothetical protein